LILAGESTEVDNLAKRATLVKGQSGGAVVPSEQDTANSPDLTAGSQDSHSVINYELWVSSGATNTPRTPRGPVDLYKRTFQSGPLSRPKILDVFA
jgi:hypothetical protein